MGISKLNPSAGGIPYGNTAGRPTPATGKLYSNGETARIELYTANGWQNIVQETPGVASITGTYSESSNSGTITISGTNFVSGAIASAIGTNGVETQAQSTTYNSIVQLTAVFANLSNAYEPYDIKVTNPSNLFGLIPDALYVNASPVWQTASGSLGTFAEQVSVSVSATATDSDSTITYSLASGSSLPSGLTLNSSSGLISGTLPTVAADTTYTFTINASDGVNTVVSRSFSITALDNRFEALLVGGGGGGGYDRGSGGGAGGYVEIPAGVITFRVGSSYNISVGTGGAGGTGSGVLGGTGGSSTLVCEQGTLTAVGGGGGNMTGSGSSGGSGGGGGWSSGSAGSATQSSQSGLSGQYGFGNAGGAGGTNVIGGGGGAGAAGSSSAPTTSSNRPNGGIGKQSSITGTATYYAGGGGGGQAFDGPNGNTTPYFYLQGLGGTGGGGNGGNANGGAGYPGTANTGGGGGGGANIPQGLGAAGGSGVVIIAYPNSWPAITTIPGTLTYDQPTRSGYRVYRFTAGSGSITF